MNRRERSLSSICCFSHICCPQSQRGLLPSMRAESVRPGIGNARLARFNLGFCLCDAVRQKIVPGRAHRFSRRHGPDRDLFLFSLVAGHGGCSSGGGGYGEIAYAAFGLGRADRGCSSEGVHLRHVANWKACCVRFRSSDWAPCLSASGCSTRNCWRGPQRTKLPAFENHSIPNAGFRALRQSITAQTYSAAARRIRSTGCSLIGQCTIAAKMPSATPSHQTGS